MNPPENPPNTTLVAPAHRAGGGVERVVGAVLAPHAQEGGVPAAFDPALAVAPKSQSHRTSARAGRQRQASWPFAMCRAKTASL